MRPLTYSRARDIGAAVAVVAEVAAEPGATFVAGATERADWMKNSLVPTVGFPAQAKAPIRANGTALVQSATADLGTGQYTVMTQVAADALGLTPDRVSCQFVEVRVDPDFRLVRVRPALGVFDIGRVLNQKTARSQGIGGMVFGIGMALLEHSVVHPSLGTFVSPDLAGYLLPVNADVPAIDAHFAEVEDPYVNSLGAKGVGEIGITGVAAAIASAVYHATGKRVRDLPIASEALL